MRLSDCQRGVRQNFRPRGALPLKGLAGPTPDTATSGAVRDGLPGLLFDLDGTLVDSVYQHVTAWHDALAACGIETSVWRIHRRIGMSGGLFLHALQREAGRQFGDALLARLAQLHAGAYLSRAATVRLLPGARELVRHLSARGLPYAIARGVSRPWGAQIAGEGLRRIVVFALPG